MIRLGQAGKARILNLVEDSPLRDLDPRTKLAMSIGASLVVMAPLERLVLFLVGYAILLIWGKLIQETLHQIWRLKWVLILLFALDWWLIGLEHAATIVTRLTLLTCTFSLFFATTSTRELTLALEWFRVPSRYAFSVSVAFQSIGILGDEWRSILEAQQARGAWEPPTGFRKLVKGLRDWISITVPAIVLTTKRAWAITEAAHARGFNAPQRRSYRTLSFSGKDWLFLALTTGILFFIFLW
jgi:energy-coupling factor transporter transmembrane protein EcfT